MTDNVDDPARIANKDRVRAYRARMISQYRCGKCGTQDQRTLSGRTLCAKCWLKQVKRREVYKARHRCTICGKLLPQDYPYKKCEKCRAKIREQRKCEMGICQLLKEKTKEERIIICLNCPYAECIEDRRVYV